MKIFDKEFAFSSLNANDIERLEQAKAKLEKAEAAGNLVIFEHFDPRG